MDSYEIGRKLFITGSAFLIFLPYLAFSNPHLNDLDTLPTPVDSSFSSNFEPYYLGSLDTVMLHYGKIAEKAKKDKQWQHYLQAITYMAYCADYHKNMDTLAFLVSQGQKIIDDNKIDLIRLDPTGVTRARFLYSVGMFKYTLGQFEEAIEVFQEIVFNKSKIAADPMLAFGSYTYIGQSYYCLENYSEALSYHKMAISVLPVTPSGHGNTYYRATNLMHQGACYFSIAQQANNIAFYDKAAKHYHQSLNLLKGDTTKNINEDAMIVTYHKLAELHQHQNHFDSALFYIDLSLHLQKKDNPLLINTYLHKGDAHLGRFQYNKSMAAYNYGLQLADERFNSKYSDKAAIYNKIGLVYQNQENWLEALKWHQKALLQLTKNIEAITHPYLNPVTNDPSASTVLINTLALKAKALQGQHNSHPEDSSSLFISIETYQWALELIEEMQSLFPSSEYKQFLSSKANSLYEEAITASFKASQLKTPNSYRDKAYFFTEKSKSFSLRGTAQDNYAKSSAGIPLQLMQEEQNYKERISMLNKEIYYYQGKDDERAERLNNEILEAKQAYGKHIDALETAFPRYRYLKGETKVISLGQLQNSIDKNTGVIEYFYGKNSLVIFGVTKSQIIFKQIDINSSLESNLRRLIGMMHKHDLAITTDSKNYRDFVKISYDVYQTILDPIIREIENKVDVLKIIPDGLLSYLPFDILLTTKPEQLKKPDYRNLHYLVKDYAISYELSASPMKQEAINVENDLRYDYIGFAPSYSQHQKRALKSNFIPTLTFLKETQQEVTYGQQLFGGKSFVDDNATEAVFRKYAGEGRILHLSMHAFIDDQNPLYSGLAFTPPNGKEQTTYNDGFLYVYELYNMKLSSELAILSGCETGFGQWAGGEGILSLGRAFKYAGCHSVLMSMWKANDNTTAEIINWFCQNVKNGMMKDEALRQAKLRFLSESNQTSMHPYFWSAFTLLGKREGLAVHEMDNSPWDHSASWLVCLCLLLLVPIVSYAYYKRSRKAMALSL